jgi:urease accessory protein
MSSTSTWLLLQLSDGSFPSGGFAHSAGLEASVQLCGLVTVDDFLDDAIVAARENALPFVRAAATEPNRLPDLDDAFDATLPLAVPNRASRAQGRSLASAAARIFDVEGIAKHAQRGPAHHAPVYGALFGSLHLSADDAATAYLHGVARAVLSAAVRLNLLGPLEAQRLLAARASTFARAVASTRAVDDVAQTAPLAELWGALHDQLDARLFQS